MARAYAMVSAELMAKLQPLEGHRSISGRMQHRFAVGPARGIRDRLVLRVARVTCLQISQDPLPPR
eukprot:882937-Rhodomonas_salina.1